jgi:hypothetical protein
LLSLFEKRKVDVGGGLEKNDVYNGLNVIDYLTKPSENGNANIGIKIIICIYFLNFLRNI